MDLATAAVLTRGWNHIRYVASLAQESASSTLLQAERHETRAVRYPSRHGAH